jgi:hypothetical protein
MPTLLSSNSHAWLNLFYSMSQIVGTSVIMFAFHLDEVFAGEIFILFFILKFPYLLFTNHIDIDKSYRYRYISMLYMCIIYIYAPFLKITHTRTITAMTPLSSSFPAQYNWGPY